MLSHKLILLVYYAHSHTDILYTDPCQFNFIQTHSPLEHTGMCFQNLLPLLFTWSIDCVCVVCVWVCASHSSIHSHRPTNNWGWLNCVGADTAHWAGWYAAKLALPNRIWAIDQWRAGKRAFSRLALHNQRELTESWQLCSLWCSPRSCSCSTISSNEREEESKKIAQLLWDFPFFLLSHSHITSLKHMNFSYFRYHC